MGQKMDLDFAVEVLLINTSALSAKMDAITKFIEDLDRRIAQLEAKVATR